ncbi:MAG: cell division protein FtsQ/DivIB [Rhizobiales bacterium]|nr:cell division protein FtsQ/DivIB [Hyphomicrobiales bacterium]
MNLSAMMYWKKPRFQRWRRTRFTEIGNRRSVRFLARAGALGILALAVSFGLQDGGHLKYPGSPWENASGRIASLFGFAADGIRISGLKYHDAEAVLTPIGVRPGGSLIGFDAANARKLLENMDWVLSAKVMRLFPNELEISVVEREPFALWQRGGSHYVIDETGSAMSSLDPARLSRLPLVTGEGAQFAISELVNQLEAHPRLKSRLLAAARVGQRRWTLHLDNGVSIALPEKDVEKALARVEELDQRYELLSKGIKGIDLRIAGRVTVMVSEAPATVTESRLKLSQRR